MREKFTYDTSAKVFRRRTLTSFQKALIVLLIIADTVISIYVAASFSTMTSIPNSLVVFSAIAPTMIALLLIIYIGIHPKGAERDFVLPGSGLDLKDCSNVWGRIRLADGAIREVEVVVPNVYGNSSLNLLEEGSDIQAGGRISTPEMYEMALEVVSNRYPGCRWEGQPTI